MDRIDLFQLHRIDPAVPADEQFGLLAALQAEGKVAAVGLSEVGVAEIEQARAIVDVVTVQNRYNLLDRASDDVLRYCTEQGIGFIPWFPVASGAAGRAGRAGRRDRRAARGDRAAGGAGLAAAALVGDAADPGHPVGGAPGGERRPPARCGWSRPRSRSSTPPPDAAGGAEPAQVDQSQRWRCHKGGI